MEFLVLQGEEGNKSLVFESGERERETKRDTILGI